MKLDRLGPATGPCPGTTVSGPSAASRSRIPGQRLRIAVADPRMAADDDEIAAKRIRSSGSHRTASLSV